jgi:hypothetical protein
VAELAVQAFLSNNAVKVIEAVVWPAAISLVLLVYRRPLVKLLTQRVSKISWAGFSLELADGRSVRQPEASRLACVRLRAAEPGSGRGVA